ncbi:MAG TPA: TRAP transporter small permease subunit [Paracoccaceae bacterium]|nr:TRAP transporter small permease subunit [Paracoccaceae bacterium]
MRVFAWAMVGFTFAFILNNYLVIWRGWPGAGRLVEGALEGPVLIQAALYALGILLGIAWVRRRPDEPLRGDAARLSGVVRFMIRAAFWAVLLIGLVDTAISFLRVEGMLNAVIGDELGGRMDFSRNRGPMVHYPLVLVGIVIAALTRGMLAVHWLALCVVLAELVIVMSRFIFSYEQAFMGDLVRFWYGALFLFASAYTLAEDGHVRVDVLYAGFTDRRKGMVNAIGTILLGLTFAWVILALGMAGRSSIINAPLVTYEITQSGFGLYVKYLMAGFLAVFAVSMVVQFCAYLLESVADWRGDPGSRLRAHDDELPVS